MISKVIIRCWTFNHRPYIRQCLDGFVMQKTNFPFTAIVVDDASTDNEQDALWDYINFELDEASIQKEETDNYVSIASHHKTNKNCTFVIMFLKYNHYSTRKNKRPYIAKWEENAEYIATCEGDDYWIDPHKLQKQVDILDSHPDYTMTCNKTMFYSERRKKYIGENYCYKKSQIVHTKDVIYRTGLFISTCSYIYRKSIVDDIPDYWAKCLVGDYPLQIMCAMKGKIYYFNDIMSVYRVENPNSWMGKQKWGSIDEKRMAVIESQINMFKGFRQDFPKHRKYFDKKIANHINRFIPSKLSDQEINKYLDHFREDIKNYSLWQKFDLWMCKQRMPRVKYIYKRLFQSQYLERKKRYK